MACGDCASLCCSTQQLITTQQSIAAGAVVQLGAWDVRAAREFPRPAALGSFLTYGPVQRCVGRYLSGLATGTGLVLWLDEGSSVDGTTRHLALGSITPIEAVIHDRLFGVSVYNPTAAPVDLTLTLYAESAGNDELDNDLVPRKRPVYNVQTQAGIGVGATATSPIFCVGSGPLEGANLGGTPGTVVFSVGSPWIDGLAVVGIASAGAQIIIETAADASFATPAAILVGAVGAGGTFAFDALAAATRAGARLASPGPYWRVRFVNGAVGAQTLTLYLRAGGP